jgi:hypothetical protein
MKLFILDGNKMELNYRSTAQKDTGTSYRIMKEVAEGL